MIKKLITLGLFSISAMSFAQKVSLMPSVGYAWRTAEMPKGITYEERNYIKGLKKGVNFDISAYYHVNHILGVGLKFSNYSASSDGRLTVMDNQGNVVTGNVSTKDNITFFGPALMISNFSEQTRHKMFVDMGLGVISYTTKTGSVKGTGSNLGAELNFGYQYQVSKNFLIGPKLGLTAGTLSKMKFNGVTYEFGEEEKEGLHRVSLSAAATFRF
ncbi:Outer membrane protein beta-barrel domain-containing protein [Chryseobacterium wanjuense]|uniref:Outer membrane protein beta-barrel domain-containing protein n=1 Tax=Chryseobacterium wanjuense TaxID=356305 RepID=A0A1I0MNL1_9FLAO|nr:acyloxyacyl hydrolase [Chryseobacterium wanjuense]SEV89571.1 Outer membrane protein beta-barrel domain-containing protein [Chryseobacterium wanjuense]